MSSGAQQFLVRMSSKAEVQPGGPSKKPSASSPPVVCINGLEAAKVPRVQALKVRRKLDGDLSEKIERKVEGKIVQVVAPGPAGKAGGQRKAAGSATASAEGEDGSNRAAPKQSASSGSAIPEDRAADRATASSGAQVATPTAEKSGEPERRYPSGEVAVASSTAAASPSEALRRGRSEGNMQEVVQSAKLMKKGADVRLDAVQDHERGAGLAVAATATLRDDQQIGGAEEGSQLGPAASSEKPQPETLLPQSQKASGKDTAAGVVPVRAHEPPAEVLANGAANSLRIEESQGASTAGNRESLTHAYERIEELLSRVSPKKPADARRRGIVQYVCNLINSCFPAAVRFHAFGCPSLANAVLASWWCWPTCA